MLTPEVNDLIMSITTDVLMLFATVASVYAIAWLRKKFGVEKLKEVELEFLAKRELALLAVKFVEQAYVNMDGPGKYDAAAQWLSDRLHAKGFDYTPDEIKGLIEAALRELKDEFGEEWANQIK